MLFVLQGPSGSGKTTQAASLARKKNFEKIITATTRPPRDGEIHGRDYYFLDEKTYDERLKNGELLAPTAIHGAKYGIPKADLLSIIQSDRRHAVVVLDDKGAEVLRAAGAFIIGLRLDEATRHARLINRGEEDRFDKEHFDLQCDATIDAAACEEAVFSELVGIIEKAIRKRKN